MKRDLQKSIEAYKTKYYHRADSKGAFYVGDIKQIIELSEAKTTRETLCKAIENALYAGYMIGYKTAKRERSIK